LQFAEPLRILLDSQMTPSSIQLRAGKLQSALDVRIATRPEAFDEQAARLRKILGQIELSDSVNEVWQARQRLFDHEDRVILKASMLSSDICSVSSELQHLAAKQEFEFDLTAQATGLMTVSLNIPADAVPRLLDQLRSRLRTSGGSVIALRIPESIRAGLDVWGCDSNALALMREIKRRFDPNRTLNPGRFVGNI
jgi:glycolate oxidase FAD binding subunit